MLAMFHKKPLREKNVRRKHARKARQEKLTDIGDKYNKHRHEYSFVSVPHDIHAIQLYINM